MAARGKPLPFSLRERIKQLRAAMTVRAAAKALGVSKSTIQKYS